MNIERRSEASLPALPFEMNFHGEGLNSKALQVHNRNNGTKSPEAILAEYRGRVSPINAMYYRRYYLRVVSKGIKLMYVWNLEELVTDQHILTIPGMNEDNFSEEVVLASIGMGLQGVFLGGIATHLCVDRAGHELLTARRNDPWGLLKGATINDLAKAEQLTGAVFALEEWDFDRMFFKRTCPGCGAKTSINAIIYDIDSAECQQCGTRPFLSSLVSSAVTAILPESTDRDGVRQRVAPNLCGILTTMGRVNAGFAHLAPVDLDIEKPKLEQVLKEAFQQMLRTVSSKRAMPKAKKEIGEALVQTAGQGHAQMLTGSIQVLEEAVAQDKPFGRKEVLATEMVQDALGVE